MPLFLIIFLIDTFTRQLPHLKLREHYGSVELKDYESQRHRNSPVRSDLLKMTGKLHPRSLNNMTAKRDLNDDNTNEHANMEEGNFTGPYPETKNNR